ncbi:MAG TPA: hypothetical protein VFR96_08170 [Povalibacter sp.]|jgi:hypothetical protein|nr:hypothetical protein [Povalibacter sp.]
MSTSAQRIFVSVIASIFFLIGIGALFSGSGGAIFGAAFIAIPAMALHQTFKRLRKLDQCRARSFEWYAKEYPHCVTPDRVLCWKCNNARINVRNLMAHTYLREHSCSRCGENLYYTPEGMAS